MESCKSEAAWGWKMPFLNFCTSCTFSREQSLEESHKQHLSGCACSSVQRASLVPCSRENGRRGIMGDKKGSGPSFWLSDQCLTFSTPHYLLKPQQSSRAKASWLNTEWMKTLLSGFELCHPLPSPAEGFQQHMQHTYFPSGFNITFPQLKTPCENMTNMNFSWFFGASLDFTLQSCSWHKEKQV